MNLSKLNTNKIVLIINSRKVQDSVNQASTKVEVRYENIAGVQIPLFKVRDLEGEGRGIEKIGLYGGAQQIEHTKILFIHLFT